MLLPWNGLKDVWQAMSCLQLFPGVGQHAGSKEGLCWKLIERRVVMSLVPASSSAAPALFPSPSASSTSVASAAPAVPTHRADRRLFATFQFFEACIESGARGCLADCVSRARSVLKQG